MSQKLKIYYHIGQPKTGSSAIQAFLNYNREKLATDYKILYPNFDIQNYAIGMMHNHSHYGLLMKSQSEAEREVIFEKIKDVVEYSKKAGYRSIIISLECFGLKDMPELFHQIVAKTGADSEIILYLRRQDLWVESAWKQWGHKIKDCDTIQDYLRDKNPNWFSNLERWLHYFSTTQFNIRPYEENFIGKDVVTDFLRTIGVSSKAGFISPPVNYYNSNYGFTREIVEILRLTKPSVSNADDHRFMDFLAETLPEKYLKKDFSASYQMLSPKERVAIISKYENSNNEIARLFFGNQRPKLFIDPLPDENQRWEPFTGLTVNTVVSVFMDILYHQSQNIKALQNEIEKLSYNYGDKVLSDIRNHSFIKIELKEFVRTIIFSHQITGKKLKKDGLIFTGTGYDPYFVIENPLPEHEIKALTFTLTTPGETIFQVFYSESDTQVFLEEKALTRLLLKGKSRFVLYLPEVKNIGHFRIDPGTMPGNYMIHHFEIGY